MQREILGRIQDGHLAYDKTSSAGRSSRPRPSDLDARDTIGKTAVASPDTVALLQETSEKL